MIGYTAEIAAREAMEKGGPWMDGAVVVRYTDGSYDAVPRAHLTDISWCNRGLVDAVVAEMNDPADWGVSDGRSLDDLTPDEIDVLVGQIAEAARNA